MCERSGLWKLLSLLLATPGTVPATGRRVTLQCSLRGGAGAGFSAVNFVSGVPSAHNPLT